MGRNPGRYLPARRIEIWPTRMQIWLPATRFFNTRSARYPGKNTRIRPFYPNILKKLKGIGKCIHNLRNNYA